MVTQWLLPVAAFLIGSIPFGLLAGRLKGIDIRSHGSGNIGATNVFRVVGKGAGITCLILDALKGFLPVLLATNLIRTGAHVPVPVPALMSLSSPWPESSRLLVELVAVGTALAAILGHNFSPWLGFKGGKGIATSTGALLGLMPAGVLVLIIVWLVVTSLTRYVSVGSIAAALALPFAALYDSWRHGPISDGTWNKPLFAFALLAAALAVWRHRSNIRRLLSGTENRILSRKNST